MANDKSTNHPPIRIGIAGLGRSGWGIHAMAAKALPDHYQVVAVTDADANRRQEAKDTFGCEAYEDFESLLGHDRVELVAIATPSQYHAPQSMEAMEAGRHVVCEKPFALSSQEADRVIAAAQRLGRIVAPFQNRRYDPVFQKLKEVADSGVLGRIVEVRINEQKFGRRWDWQTLKEYGGGSLNNTGPHFLDYALELFGEGEPRVVCHMDRALASGDADDHDKVILMGEGKPLVEVNITSACAYPQDNWLVMGTRGGLHGGRKELAWKTVDFSKMPDRPVDVTPTANRGYNREQLDWHEETWTVPADPAHSTAELFYLDLFRSIREDAPLVISPQSVRRQIALLETCHQLSPV